VCQRVSGGVKNRKKFWGMFFSQNTPFLGV
jgi:hypothetical protein